MFINVSRITLSKLLIKRTFLKESQSPQAKLPEKLNFLNSNLDLTLKNRFILNIPNGPCNGVEHDIQIFASNLVNGGAPFQENTCL